MIRSAVLTILLLAAASTFGAERDRDCTRGRPGTAKARPHLAALFATPAEPVETSRGVVATLPVMEVLVAKIGPDGKPVFACVDGEAAARRFLDAAPGAVAPARKKEEK